MYTTRNPLPTATFPPFETSHLGVSEGGLITVHVAFPESPIFQLSLLALAMSLLLTTSTIKSYMRAKRPSTPPVPAADTNDQTNKTLDDVSQKLFTAEDGRETPLVIEDQLPPPSRSSSDASHHSRKHGNPVHHTLRRTKTISANILTNSTRPLMHAQRVVVDQFAAMGREVLRPMRTMRHPAEPAIPEPPSMSEDSSADQSSTESERRGSMDSSAPSAADSTPPSSDVSLPSEEKGAESPARTRTFTLSRTLAMTFSIPSIPSIPSRAGLCTNQTPSAKGGVRRTANKDGEPIRYARPARPENSLSGVVYETRFESPVKLLFRSKAKGKTGSGSTKKTSIKQGFSLMKSSPSLRRLFFSSSYASSEGEFTGSDDSSRSRRSSLSSVATGATSVRSSISEEVEDAPKSDAPNNSSATPGCVNA